MISDMGQRPQVKHSTWDIYRVTHDQTLRRRWRIQAALSKILKHHNKVVPTLATLPASLKHASVGDTGMCPPG